MARTRLAIAIAIGAVLAAPPSAVFGALASILYAPGGEPGTRLGTGAAVLGALAALVAVAYWSWFVLPLGQRHAPREVRWGRGLLHGEVAAVLATGLLHLGLSLGTWRFEPAAWIIGLVFGVPMGLVVGLLATPLSRWVIGPRNGPPPGFSSDAES